MINKTKIQIVQDKIKRAIAEIESEENVKISFGTRRYDDSQYTCKMTVKTTATDQKTVGAVDGVNLQLSRSYGFDKNIIGESFTANGTTYKVESFKTRNRKYPIIATSKANGRNYKFSPTSVKMYIK